MKIVTIQECACRQDGGIPRRHRYQKSTKIVYILTFIEWRSNKRLRCGLLAVWQIPIIMD